MSNENKTFMIEDAIIKFSNFSGKEDKFNPAGVRNFVVQLPEDVAQQMIEDGWNVNYLKPREEGDDAVPIIRIGVRFDIRPPRVVLLTSTTRTQLDEKSIDVLDWADIKTVDLIARGFDWYVNGKGGTKAYLQSLFVTIEEDALERKYDFYDTPLNEVNE
jgi:hypothetical protein